MIVSTQKAIQILKAGGIVALPTETVYGLAGSIFSQAALQSIFETKKRPFFDPLIVHVSDLSEAKKLVTDWPKPYDVLAKKFWPGALTLIAPKKSLVADLVTSGLDNVALRCPNHPIFLQVLRETLVPLAAPSANRFGKTSPTTAAHVEGEFSGQVPVVDGGACEIGVESTVVRASLLETKEWSLEILRPGGISREQIAEELNHSGIKFQFAIPVRKDLSPGTLEHHYQPESPLILMKTEHSDQELIEHLKAHALIAVEKINRLSLNDSPVQAARELYSQLRRLSEPGAALAFHMRSMHEEPQWEAVLDRLKKASTYRI